MTDDQQLQIELIRTQIVGRETYAAKLRAEIAATERELDEFQKRYDKIIKPMHMRIDVIQSAIDELTKQNRAARGGIYEVDYSTIAPGYVSVEEQYRRAWSKTDVYDAIHAEITPKPSPAADALKRLYRDLARRFHPDLGGDQKERDRRTAIMSQINAAYTAGDLDALQALADDSSDPNAPLSALTLRSLRKQLDELDAQIGRLTSERDELLYGATMKLKLDDKLARLKGRDLLAEMRAQMQHEYDVLLAQLDEMRNGLG